MEFSDWFTKKYLEWRGNNIGNSGSITQFARLFGAPQSLISEWMKKGGKIPKSKKYIDAIIARYGDEVYDFFPDLPRDGNIPISQLPPPLRRRLSLATREVDTALKTQGITAEDPRAEQITIQIFEKHGFKYTATDTE